MSKSYSQLPNEDENKAQESSKDTGENTVSSTNDYIQILQNEFTWQPDLDDNINPIRALADHGLLPDNGLLSNKIINAYGKFVYEDIQARMNYTELKTTAGRDYRENRGYWQGFKDWFKRKEPDENAIGKLRDKDVEVSLFDRITGVFHRDETDMAVYTERELAERMIEIVRKVQGVEQLLNRTDLPASKIIEKLRKIQEELGTTESRKLKSNLRMGTVGFKFQDKLPGLDKLVEDEDKDITEVSESIDRLIGRIQEQAEEKTTISKLMDRLSGRVKEKAGDNTTKSIDCNEELQKWLNKRFDQLNRGFEKRIRNVNIYKAPGNTGTFTLGRAYTTSQDVKKLFRTTGHYYAECGRITKEMQHMPDITCSAFSSAQYPLANAQSPGDALKIAHYIQNSKSKFVQKKDAALVGSNESDIQETNVEYNNDLNIQQTDETTPLLHASKKNETKISDTDSASKHSAYKRSQMDYRTDKNAMLKQEDKRKKSSAFRNFFRDIGRETADAVREEVDFVFGTGWRSSTTKKEKLKAFEILTQDLNPVTQENTNNLAKEVQSNDSTATNSDDQTKVEQKEEITVVGEKKVMEFASAPGRLDLLVMGDALTSATRFGEKFVEAFASELADKRPFISAVAFSAYGVFGLTAYSPALANSLFSLVSKGLAFASKGHVSFSSEKVVLALNKEINFICKYLGGDNSKGERVITSAFINMKGYIAIADSINNLTGAESTFIKDICKQAETNSLTEESLWEAGKKAGLTAAAVLAILGLGVVLGIGGHFAGLHGIPINKIVNLSPSELIQPKLALGSAMSSSLIMMKALGTFGEGKNALGNVVNNVGVAIEKNKLDYAMLIMLVAGGLDKEGIKPDKKAKLLNQFKRLLRDYPGLIQHSAVLGVAQAHDCVPSKRGYIASVIIGLTKLVTIPLAGIASIPVLLVNLFTGGNTDVPKRSIYRLAVAVPLILSQVATMGMTLGRMLTRLTAEILFRFGNLLWGLTDRLLTSAVRKPLATFGESNESEKQIRADKEVEFVVRRQNVNNGFVDALGLADDKIAKPVTNVLLRWLKQTTQVLLTSGEVTRKGRKEAFDTNVKANAEMLDKEMEMTSVDENGNTKSKNVGQTTKAVFDMFGLSRDGKKEEAKNEEALANVIARVAADKAAPKTGKEPHHRNEGQTREQAPGSSLVPNSVFAAQSPQSGTNPSPVGGEMQEDNNLTPDHR